MRSKRKHLPALLLALALLAGLSAPCRAADAEPFRDLVPGAWYEPYVLRMASEDVVNGYDDGSFRPDAEVTWGQALKLVILTAMRSRKVAQEDAHWAEGYRAWAEKRGWSVPGQDALDEVIRRDALAELAAAALELSAPTQVSPYADADGAAVLALYEAGIMEGSVEGEARLFHGESGLRRSEVCAVLCRMSDYVAANFVFVSGYRAAINFELPMNTVPAGAFSTDARGRLQCADGSLGARFGVDVSYYQGAVDWSAVASDGVEFAILRLGFRGYGSEGRLVEDTRFQENFSKARAAGLDLGVYFFSQALNAEEAREEAAFVLERLGGQTLEYPVVFDWERQTAKGSRTAEPDWAQVSEAAAAFCEAIRAAGYTPMVYFNKHMAYLELDLSRLTDYDWWLAWYQPNPDFVYRYRMWQYSSKGRVQGIDGNVDLNLWFT